jgi:glutathione peroxidase
MRASTLLLATALPLSLALACEAAPGAQPASGASAAASTTKAAPLDFVVTDIDGKAVDLKSLRGKVLLVVNVASECGYTPQYAELQQLYASYKDKGLVVLGFPSNDHGGQEPADGAAIKAFASTEYGVTFPLFQKVHTTGAEMAPLYQSLTAQKGPVKWNFTKFLVGKDGVVRERFDSGVEPQSPKITGAIDALLQG